MEYLPVDNIAITIDDETFSNIGIWLDATRKGDNRLVLFQNPDFINSGEVFLLAHGTPDGNIMIGDEVFTPAGVLADLLCSGMISPDTVKTIYTISCHGGLQAGTTLNGVTMVSLHNSIDQIFIEAYDRGFKTSTGKMLIILFKKRNIVIRALQQTLGRFLAWFRK